MRRLRRVVGTFALFSLVLSGSTFVGLEPIESALAAPPDRVQICHFRSHEGDFVTGNLGNFIDECNNHQPPGRLRNVSASSCTNQHAAEPRIAARTMYTCDGAVVVP